MALSEEDLYEFHIERMIRLLDESRDSWTKHSLEPKILEVCVLNCGPTCLSGKLSLFMPSFISMSNPDCDYEVRDR